MGDTDLTPYDMGTFGSRTTPTMAPQLRKAAAAARELLLDLAAEQMKADRTTLAAGDGKITNLQTKQSLSYGELTRGQKLLKQISDDVPTTPADMGQVLRVRMRLICPRVPRWSPRWPVSWCLPVS